MTKSPADSRPAAALLAMTQINVQAPVPTSRKAAAEPAPAAPARSRRATRGKPGSGLDPAVALQGELLQTREALEARTEELAASLAVTRATLESTADGILVTDERGRVTAFNEKFLQIWGLAREDVDHAMHGDLARLVASSLLDPQTTERRIHSIYAAPPDGDTKDEVEMADGRVLERFSSVQRIAGRSVGRVWSYRDISARLEAEAALRDEAGILHFLNRTGAAIAATLDIATLLQTVIDAATPVSGAVFGAFFYRDDAATPSSAPARGALDPRVESAGRCAPAGIPMLALAGVTQSAGEPLDPQHTAALFDAAWRGDQTVRCADVTTEALYGTSAAYFGLADGFAPVRSFLAVPVTLRNGMTVGGLFFGHPDVGVFTERTERIVVGVAAHAAIALDNARLVEGMRRVALERERLVEAERAARAESVQAANMKDEFLATLSHELRTPLTAILGWAKVLLLQRSDAQTQQRGLEAIARNAGAQASLIEDLLDMSRIVSGKVQLDLQAADLSRVVDAALATVRASAAAKEIALVRRVDRAACRVHGDPARLQQVVENLLSNAVKFTPRHGRVEVSVASVDGQVELSVSDTGLGIEPEFVSHVFDQFRQADSSTTRRHGGLGLGLALVKQLVGMHGGAVSARSAGIGQGARFIVRLPCGGAAASSDAAPAAVAAAASGAFSDVDLHGLHLLVVDDDADARELIAQLLVECGADVRQAANAADALHEFQRDTPDVLLSDIGMPERDGYELIRDIRSFDAAHGGNVPAVALTAFTRSEDRAQAILAGYQAHITKPIQPNELVTTVAELAERRKAA
jgi:PAS domain S-box-containing protein